MEIYRYLKKFVGREPKIPEEQHATPAMMALVDQKQFKRHFGEYRLIEIDDGNRVIVGKTADPYEDVLCTSPVVYYTQEWCYTKSGSLYSLGQRID